MAKKILITGGAGFIGSTIADTFLAAGWDVAVVDDLSTGKRENVPAAARFYPCDVRSAAAAEAIERERPDVLCHHAAQIDVRRSMTDPRFDADVNVGGLLNLMQAAVRAGSVKQVLFASSGGATYGDTAGHPHARRATRSGRSRTTGPPRRPASSTSASSRPATGSPYAALRYANVYGPRQDPHGEAGRGGHLLRPAARREAVHHLRRRQADPGLRLRGRRGARQPAGGASASFAGALNIGTGVETDVTQLHAGLARAAGSSAPPVHAEARLGEQRRSCIDPSAAGRALGWRPEVSHRPGAGPDLPVLQGEARVVRGRRWR